MQSNPLVSVCIPIYNTEKFVRETLDCVLKQTYTNLEIIFSDNCSTDKTVEIIKSYNDPRIKLFQNSENIGLVNNFIKVLSYATGKYMMFLGADDGMDFTAVEKGVAILEDEKNKDLVIVNTHIKIINDQSKVVHTKKYIFGSGKISSYWGIRCNLFWGSNIIGEPNGTIFRRDAYEKTPNPKFKNGNTWTLDLDMKNELFLLGNGYMIPEALGQFRLSAQSTSNKELKFTQAKLFREYAYVLYKDKRYKLSFFWVITATINSFILQIARNVFYKLFIKNK